MDRFLELLTNLNDFMWTYFLIGLVIVTGIYFTFSTKFVQFTYIKEMFRLITEKPKVGKDGEQKGVSAFQAFTISAASRVGTGTIAGVAIAIAMGGPGSVFWMWVMALFGGASSFAESTLAQVYKVRDSLSWGTSLLYGKRSRSKMDGYFICDCYFDNIWYSF